MQVGSCGVFEKNDLLKKLELEKKKRKRGKQTNLLLTSKNKILANRSRQLSRLKLTSYFSMRTVQIVDAANFSDSFGYVDEVLLETDVPMFEFDENVALTIVKVTSNHVLRRVEFNNGEFGVCKSHKPVLKNSISTQMSNLIYEAKIILLAGKHPNIVYCHGLSTINSTPVLVLGFESDATLVDMFNKYAKIKTSAISSILSGLSDAICHIHNSNILHNQITASNVCLRYKYDSYSPVLVGFSSACRANSAKSLTIVQQSIWKDALHIPKSVKNGLTPPSFCSDVYAFGHLCRRFVLRNLKDESMKENIFFKLAKECLKEDPAVMQHFLDLVDLYLFKTIE